MSGFSEVRLWDVIVLLSATGSKLVADLSQTCYLVAVRC